MKATVSIAVGCCILLLNSNAFAGGCSSDRGGCGSGACNPYETNCQCTDPSCHNPWDSDCISRAYCCQAFGNIGAR